MLAKYINKINESQLDFFPDSCNDVHYLYSAVFYCSSAYTGVDESNEPSCTIL